MQRRKLIRAAIGGILSGLVHGRTQVSAEEWISSVIYEAAGRYGVSGEWLHNTAVCESGLDPWAYNEFTGDCGVFQFNPNTWAEWGGDPAAIWDVWSQADMAAWAFSVGMHNHWCCSGTWQGWQTCS